VIHEIRPVTIELRHRETWEPIDRVNTAPMALARAWLLGHRTFRLSDKRGVIVTVSDGQPIDEYL
jgi:hypothetical protein